MSDTGAAAKQIDNIWEAVKPLLADIGPLAATNHEDAVMAIGQVLKGVAHYHLVDTNANEKNVFDWASQLITTYFEGQLSGRDLDESDLAPFKQIKDSADKLSNEIQKLIDASKGPKSFTRPPPGGLGFDPQTGRRSNPSLHNSGVGPRAASGLFSPQTPTKKDNDKTPRGFGSVRGTALGNFNFPAFDETGMLNLTPGKKRTWDAIESDNEEDVFPRKQARTEGNSGLLSQDLFSEFINTGSQGQTDITAPPSTAADTAASIQPSQPAATDPESTSTANKSGDKSQKEQTKEEALTQVYQKVKQSASKRGGKLPEGRPRS